MKVNYGILIVLILILFSLLGYVLFYPNPYETQPVSIGQSIPEFEIAELSSPATFSQDDLKGHVSLLNFWSTECDACKREHDILMKISSEYQIPLYGILYKSNLGEARQYLAADGNPYLIVGVDNDGSTSIDFGIYGTPETFVINSQGEVVYRYIGAINQRTWDTVLYPIIKVYLQKE